MARLDPRELVGVHPTARRLKLDFDPVPLVTDLDALGPDWWKPHAGPYHNGGWESVSMWAPRGDAFEQRSFGGEFGATPALLRAPAVREVMDAFPAQRNRVRLMRLQPGGRILPHRDPLHDIDPGLVRLHVPLVTSDQVDFRVAGRRVVMGPGEVWHVDVRFSHEVENRGEAARVHLVLDLVRCDWLDREMERAEAVARERLLGYFLVESLPAPLRRRLRR